MISLYDHQSDLLQRASARMAEKIKRLLIVLSTGGGKTRIATRICESSIARGVVPVWFMVHRRELLDQAAKAFSDAGLPFGYVARGHDIDGDRPVQIVLIDSLPRRKHYLSTPRVIIPDEAHHCTAPKWSNVQAEFPRAFYIGLTATPQRLDGKGLGTHFDEIVQGPGMRWLIDNGFLADYRIFAPPPTTLDLSHVGHVAGEFNHKQVTEAVAKSTIVGDSIAEYRKHAAGKRCLIRAVGVEESEKAAEAFRKEGYVAVHLDAKTSDHDRRRLFNDFRRGEVTHLCNVDLFGEGVDIPGVECLIDLRPTESLTYYLQFVGRMLRAAPGKTHGIYLDQVGNTMRHGMPDEEREWSLEGRRKRKKPAAIFTCKACFGAFPKPFRICPSCGEFSKTLTISRGAPKRVEGELHELSKDMFGKLQRTGKKYDPAQGRAKTMHELVQYAIGKGYDKPEGWAKRIFDARMRKRRGRAA
jgi:superfamily II DNA or RNA helicase